MRMKRKNLNTKTCSLCQAIQLPMQTPGASLRKCVPYTMSLGSVIFRGVDSVAGGGEEGLDTLLRRKMRSCEGVRGFEDVFCLFFFFRLLELSG